jgi:hypothetical protein
LAYRKHSNTANPSSHAAMAPSLLSTSLSRARSFSHSSTATTDIATMLGGEEGLHQSRSWNQCYDKKQPTQSPVQCKTSLADDEARPGATSILRARTTVGGHHGWAPAPRTLAMVSATSHHRQGSRANFKISGKAWRFFCISLKIEIAR